MASLQEQLLKAGLADEKKAREVRNEKRKQRKQQPKGATTVNEAEERARRRPKRGARQPRCIARKVRRAEAERALAQAAERGQIERRACEERRAALRGGSRSTICSLCRSSRWPEATPRPSAVRNSPDPRLMSAAGCSTR